MPVVLHINGKTRKGDLGVVDRSLVFVPLSSNGITPVADSTGAKYGGACVRINGGTLIASDGRAIIGPTENFTVRGYFEFEAGGGATGAQLFGQSPDTSYDTVRVWTTVATGVINLRVSTAALAQFAGTAPFVPTVGTQYHIEVTRNDGTVTLWINGVSAIVLAIGAGASLYAGAQMCIGGTGNRNPAFDFNGRVDDFQVIRGECLHTAAFTPPDELTPPDETDGPHYHPATLLGPLRAAGYTPPADLHQFKRLAVPGNVITHFYFGGRGIVTNTVKVKGTPNAPVHRKVWLMRERDAIVIREVWSDPVTGIYAFPFVDERERYSAITQDYEGNFRSVIANNLIPDLMP